MSNSINGTSKSDQSAITDPHEKFMVEKFEMLSKINQSMLPKASDCKVADPDDDDDS